MSVKRSYGEGCLISHALDLVGERWALLVVRELLLGPKRFTDLEVGLAPASPNVLSQRLKDLEGIGVLSRRRLGRPSATWVYELTDWGRRLERVLDELSAWAQDSPFQNLTLPMSTDSVLLAIRSRYRATTPAAPAKGTCGILVDDESFVIRFADDRIDIARETARDLDATVETDLSTLQELVIGDVTAAEATAAGRLRIDGDLGVVDLLIIPS